jgi:hypothetical protein
MYSTDRIDATTYDHCIHQNLTSADDERHIQGILPGMLLDCSNSPGQPFNPRGGHRHLGEMKKKTRNMPVEERAQRTQRDLKQNAKDLDARDPRSTVHAEMMPYGIWGQYIAMVAGRFGEYPKDFRFCFWNL